MRTGAAALIVLVVLGIAGPASAKGMTGGTIEGEGIDGVLTITGGEGEHTVVTDTGVLDLVWRSSPSRRLDAAPTDELGPELVIRWSLLGPGGEVPIVQRVYPHAEGGPVTAVAPGQPLWGEDHTIGGWLRAPGRLVATLEALGVPTAAELAASNRRSRDWAPIAAGLAAAVVLGAAAFGVARRRGEVAPAAG